MLGLEVFIGFAIGLSLGLLGGGGSILTVPALVYLVGLTPQAAVTASLAIVGANSLVGASLHRAQGTLDWRVAALFGGVGMLVAYLASGISRLLPAPALLIGFALLMFFIGAMMLARKTEESPRQVRSLWVVLASGAGVGLLTGILGVGGGFLIVPALVMLVGLQMQEAVGTSLIVIAMNSLAGLAGHLGGESVDGVVILTFTLAGLAGTFAGAKLSHYLPALKLQKIFAWFLLALAIFLLVDNLLKIW
jgi:uncharacterized membrane protein YfcA